MPVLLPYMPMDSPVQNSTYCCCLLPAPLSEVGILRALALQSSLAVPYAFAVSHKHHLRHGLDCLAGPLHF